jgi:hypothetical protein
MTDVDTITLLTAIEKADGTDAHRTKGWTPVWRAADMEVARRLEADGLALVHERWAPIGQVGRGMILGQGWVSLTDAGRALVTGTVSEG